MTFAYRGLLLMYFSVQNRLIDGSPNTNDKSDNICPF